MFVTVGLDERQRFEGLIRHESMDWWVVGCITERVVLFDNAIYKTPGVTGSWQAIDVSEQIGNDALFGFWLLKAPGGGTRYIMDVRGDSPVDTIDSPQAISWAIAGISKNNQLQGYVNSRGARLLPLGYSVGFATNPISPQSLPILIAIAAMAIIALALVIHIVVRTRYR